MHTIQVVLDKKLLREADTAVKRLKTNRSALIREALQAHLKSLEIREKEERERRAYEKCPQDLSEIDAWEKEQVWLD